MTTKTPIRCAVGALALLLAGGAFAQITFFGREDFRGRAVTYEQSVGNLDESRLEERVSSVQVRGGQWQLCSEPWFRGDCVTVRPGDYPSLREVGLNNRISSAREIGWVGGQPAGRGIVFYEGPRFSGRSFTVDSVAETLGGFNDRARSMIIYEGEWELCEHDRFRGGCATFRPGEHPDLGRLAGDVSSVRPVGATPGGPIGGGEPWGRGVRAVLYEASEFRGRHLVVTDDVLYDLARNGFNDRVSSLRIERGYWVFCSDANFAGTCRTFGPGDYATLPPGLENRISSGRRVHDRYPYQRDPDWRG